MFRKLSLAVAISGLLSPVGVHALGLGDIHLGSALNQRLNAEISVHLARTEELDDIKIELASPEAFARAGIGRPFLLSNLRFSPVHNSDGEAIIAVTSREPIREPFLNFLVEVNWPKGRLVREYTVLLDPPVTVQRSAAPVESPVVAPQLRMRTSTQAVGVVGKGEAREYGPVVAEETLWSIASRMRAEGESVEQVMMALLDNNSNAFIHNNINRLKRGSILRLPASSDVQSLDRKQARSEFLAQTSQWRDQNSVTASSMDMPSAAPASDQATKVQDHLKLVSASQVTEAGAIEASADKSADFDGLEQELILVREASEVVRQEGAQLRTRVGELEAQLQDIQRLLTLRNDQLAQIQSGQQQDPQLVENQSESEVVADEIPSEVSVSIPAAEEVVQENQEIQPVALIEQEPTTPIAAEPEEMVEVAPVEETAPPPVEETAPPPFEEKPVAVAPVKQPAPLADTIFDNPSLMAAAGGVVALLLAIAVFIIRRRKSTEAEFAESILVAPKGAAVESSSDADLAPASTDETSLLSDFSPSDIDALQDETGEVDPLSEADVYVAYGRYQQAEELIQQAIEKDDERVELKFKLLEIYYSTQNKIAFAELAQRLANNGAKNQSPQAWAQVVSMGQELLPNEVLFGAVEGEQSGDVSETAVENAVDELDLGDLEAELGLDGDDSLMNVDLEQGLAELDEAVESAEEANFSADELGDLSIADESLNLDDIDLSAELDGEINDLDLDDLSLSLDSELVLDESESVDGLGSEEIDLGSLSDDLESLSDDLDSGDFEINHDEMDSKVDDEIQIEELVEGTSEDDDLSVETEELTEDLLDDEIETKLDLARAYADMGDKEGAENILQEVINEGTAGQIEEAEALIKSLS